MKLSLVLTWTLRESRGSRGRLVFFTTCIAIGVAAVVGVSALAASFENGIRSQSKKLLAADLVVEARSALPEDLDSYFEPHAFERTDVRELATMASAPGSEDAPGKSRLVELKVIDGTYPFYGELGLSPPGDFGQLLHAGSAVVAPAVLGDLNLELGDEIRIGGAVFEIAAVVEDEPDRLDFSLTLGPRVFLDAAGLERTALLGVGNRVKYRALYRMAPDFGEARLSDLKDKLRQELPSARRFRIETHNDAQPRVRRSIRRVERFLGLVALLSLILGGLGVAQIVRTWVAARTKSVAVLRCLGMRPKEVLSFYLGNVLALALLGSVVGAAFGSLLPWLVPLAAPDLLPADLVQGFPLLACLRGIGLGAAIALLFSLPALSAVWRVTPARVLRSDAEPLPPNRRVYWGSLVGLALGVFSSAWTQGGDAEIAAWFTLGLGVLALFLALGARTLIALSRRLPRQRLNPYLMNGMAALARPGAGTVGAIVALGLGVMVVLAMLLIEGRLQEEIGGSIPDEAPSSFLIDIQPDQWDGVRTILEEEAAQGVSSVPVVMARLSSIDGVSVEELAQRNEGGRRRPRWVLTREQRLTYMEELPETNEILEGSLWSHPERNEVSLEEDYARDMRVGVGSTLVFDVQGVPVELYVSSLRKVEWQSFEINFFLIVEPGVLEKAPQFRLAAARMEQEREQRVQDQLAFGFPNVTLLRIRPILERILELMGRLAFGVRLLGGFTILSGIVILAGSVSATALRRRREAAVLKTLGITRAGVAMLFATEYALGGALAGLLGAAGAYALTWGFLEHVADMRAQLPPFTWAVACGLTAIFAAAAGILASGKALRSRPLESLR